MHYLSFMHYQVSTENVMIRYTHCANTDTDTDTDTDTNVFAQRRVDPT